MATSFTRTRTQIAQRVLGKVIKIGAASTASADYETVYEAIDLRLKEMHRLGIFWRKVTTVPVTFSLGAGINTASAGAGDILYPLRMTVTDGSRDEGLEIINIAQYAALADKTTTGVPEKVLWKGGSEFIFWPVPTTAGTGKLTYHKIADDTSAGAAIDVDVAMIRPMMDLVKYDVADDYGIPEQTVSRWAIEATKAERDIRKLGAPRVDLESVYVDDFDSRSHRETDYGR